MNKRPELVIGPCVQRIDLQSVAVARIELSLDCGASNMNERHVLDAEATSKDELIPE